MKNDMINEFGIQRMWSQFIGLGLQKDTNAKATMSSNGYYITYLHTVMEHRSL